MLDNVENAFHLTDYNNMSDLYEFQQQYNMAQEFIKHRDEFYQSFTISRFSRARDFIEGIELGKITNVVWIDYEARVCSAPGSSLEYKTYKRKDSEEKEYGYYQVSIVMGYNWEKQCVLDEECYAIKCGDLLYVIRHNEYSEDKTPKFTFDCDNNTVTAAITYKEQFEKGPRYYNRITTVYFIFDVHTNELVEVKHDTHEEFEREMTSWEFCEWMD